MYRVRKREGELVDFNISKISSAITKLSTPPARSTTRAS